MTFILNAGERFVCLLFRAHLKNTAICVVNRLYAGLESNNSKRNGNYGKGRFIDAFAGPE